MISIVIPIYNRASIICDTLSSILAQRYKNWECIIVDDGSTDDTVRVTQDFIKTEQRFKFFNRPESLLKGPSSCRNYGVHKSSGDYIQFFDSDDIMHPEHLEIKMNSIENLDFVICKIQGFVGEFNEIYFDKESVIDILYPIDPFKAFMKGEFLMCMVVPLWRKSSLIPHLPIREDLHILEDRELHARILSQRPNFKIINKTLIYYRRDYSSSTNSFFKNIDFGLESFLMALKSALSHTNDHEVKLSVLKKILGFFRQALAERNFKAAKRCLDFTHEEGLWFSTSLKLKRLQIIFFFYLVKIIKRGDTRYKFLFKV